MRASEFVSGYELYQEFEKSRFWDEEQDLFQRMLAAGNFIRSKNLPREVARVALRKLVSRLTPDIKEQALESVLAVLDR